ncbi:glycoside hydrolase family 2 [Isoptericola sp. S6320L]|uniref:glycoside hydrolase family 2 protein n=1 Tax=Isoptericola sp. S6320L TaxID=2926411 RepID=UPI001FF31B64|nr:glycoside hydrolase family 2 TIM barrel-domain containing protein [Isoptericola sp. S6320L]MCK0118131.1 glycoside hydrolase family 2 [Isoptericola sp. S6320L]
MRETSTTSTDDGTYPRPQLARPRWHDLSGEWEFAIGDDDAPARRAGGTALPRRIQVPYPPESPLSGIGDTSPYDVVWYRRTVTADDVATAGLGTQGDALVIHFGAVDHDAQVWADGHLLGAHTGGQTPFTLEVPAEIVQRGAFTLVVRAYDDPRDVTQPRGKQDWRDEPHSIWYHRTTGIWQPVWLEAVPRTAVVRLDWRPDVPGGAVELGALLAHRPERGTRLAVEITAGEETLARQEIRIDDAEVSLTVPLHRQTNGQAYEELLWSPERPTLLDARVTVTGPDGALLDDVTSYLGLRSTGEADGKFLLNDRPYYVRSVLEQGYWPESHLAAPSAQALRDEVQLIKDLGFNAARVHQKAEDPRFLYWADRLGLLVWGEVAAPFAFTPRAVERTVREWTDLVLRDRSHPCIVTWVPVNESWGVQHIAHDPAQQHLTRALYHLTKALDPTRPVISNDGWEHTESDLLTLHDYAAERAVLEPRYATREALDALPGSVGPAGRRVTLLPCAAEGKPVMVTEFGGVTWAPDADIDTWGYSVASSPEDFEARVRALFDALHASPVLAGVCYTQLTDTLQEANGLTDEHRKPKLPVETIRSIVRGAPAR